MNSRIGVTYWLGAVSSGHGHGWLEERALEEDTVVREGLVHGSEDLLLHLSGSLDVVVTVHEDLGLDDWDEAWRCHVKFVCCYFACRFKTGGFSSKVILTKEYLTPARRVRIWQVPRRSPGERGLRGIHRR